MIERLRRSSAGKLVVLLALLVVLPIAWVRHDLVLAALAYFLMIATVLWHVLALRSELGRFTRQAREVKHRRGGPQFGEVNRLTEFAPLARGLDSMVRSLEHSRRAVREAAEETAHALKSPIGAVAQSIEPLRERVGADDRDGRRAIAIIDGSVERLGNLVPVVRELGELPRDSCEGQAGQSAFSQLVCEALVDYRITAGRAGIRLVESIAPGIKVDGGDHLLEPVLENILDNAISFSRRDGRIWIRLEALEAKCRLVIEDEGPGVAPEQMANLFERYFSTRLAGDHDPASAGEEPGHFGLGLWIVRRNVEALGGRVDAANRTPTGLSIVVELPLAGDRRQPGQPLSRSE